MGVSDKDALLDLNNYTNKITLILAKKIHLDLLSLF